MAEFKKRICFLLEACAQSSSSSSRLAAWLPQSSAWAITLSLVLNVAKEIVDIALNRTRQLAEQIHWSTRFLVDPVCGGCSDDGLSVCFRNAGPSTSKRCLHSASRCGPLYRRPPLKPNNTVWSVILRPTPLRRTCLNSCLRPRGRDLGVGVYHYSGGKCGVVRLR